MGIKATTPKRPTTGEIASLVGVVAGLQLTGFMLANRDANATGIDDYIARKIADLMIDIQTYQITGKLPGEE